MKPNCNWFAGVLFFCFAGSVCSTSALAQDAAGDEASAISKAAQLFKAATQEQSDSSAESAQAEQNNNEDGEDGVKVGTFGQIDLHVKDLDLTKVLQLLSIQSQRNIVASRNVTGSVSADLYGVDFFEALDAILHPNGFGYKERGQFIFVYTQEELRQIEQADRKVVTKVFRLNYMNAADASTFLTPLLSEAGAIALNGETTTGFQPSISDGGEDTFVHAATLVVRDYPENLDEMVEVLKQLDVKPKQVLIEATILQARLSETNRFGVDVSILANFDFAEFMNPASVVNDIINGSASPSGQAIRTNPGQVGSGDSTVQFGIIDEQFAVFVEALDKVTDTTVLAKPKMLVLNRQKADLLVGERLGYLSTSATETSTTQTVEFLDIGTQLTVRPFVADDDSIRLEIRPSVSDGETVLSDGLVIPNQRTQELVTNVMLQNSQTVILGGLFKEDTTVSRRQVPGVGDVPILGAAFKGQDDQVDRSEVIFMIRPTIVRDKALYRAGEHAREAAEYATLGAREGLLPWSREKLTNSHYRDAQMHIDNGDKDRALWSVNMALRLNPNFIEAQRMKNDLTGSHRQPVNRSILDEAVDMIIETQSRESGVDARPDKSDSTTKANDDTTQDRDMKRHDAKVAVPVEVDETAVIATPDKSSAEPVDEPRDEAEKDTRDEGVIVIDGEPVGEPQSAKEPAPDEQEAASDDTVNNQFIETLTPQELEAMRRQADEPPGVQDTDESTID